MTIRQIVCLAFFSFALVQTAHAKDDSDWGKLLDEKKVAEAQKLCDSLNKSPEIANQVEAQKCFANIALSKGQILSLQGNDIGGGTLGSGYTPEAVDQAIVFLDKGITLAPQDLSIHQGRLWVLESVGRFDQMAKALDESCTIYQGKDALDAWLAYPVELINNGQLQGALALLHVLDKHYPNSHDVIGDMGAALMIWKKDNEALPYLIKAQQLAPNDPIDVWNLGRTYGFMNQNDLAEEWYQKALKLTMGPEDKKERLCYYSEFVENNLHHSQEACELSTANCTEKRYGCEASSSDKNTK